MTDPASGPDVPLTREEAVVSEELHEDEQTTLPGDDVGLLDRADPDGSAQPTQGTTGAP